MRNFLVSGVMLFLVFQNFLVKASDKKRIAVSHGVSNEDFFIPNQQFEQLKKSEKEAFKKISKKNKKTHSNQHEVEVLFADIPQCIGSYNIIFNNFSHEIRYEFCTKQLFNDVQQLYLTELTRLGWNVELFSVLKESIISAQKPSKKLLIIIDRIKGGWFSQDACKVIIIKKEQ